MAEPTQGLKTWIDTETTGLSAQTDLLLEVAVVITTDHLDVVAEYSAIISNDLDEVHRKCDEFVRTMHERSGLFEELPGATLTASQVETEIIAFLGEHGAIGTVTAGNNIGFDRDFLATYMPTLNNSALHYRKVDVSTVKELARCWSPAVFAAAPVKSLGHRALDDIRESITELRHYRDAGFLATHPESKQ